MSTGLAYRIARALAPELMDADQVKALVAAEVKQARLAMPVMVDYDPKGEGYRRIGGQSDQIERDLMPMAQELMIQLAYYLYDTSGLVKRFVRDTRNFVIGEGVQLSVGNDTDGDALRILQDFWTANKMDLKLHDRVEFLGVLGEQCWPAWVNPYNGAVKLSYIDPQNIDVVIMSQVFPDQAVAVKLKGTTGRTGQTISVIREETDPRKKEFGRLVGDCFLWAVNKPPNASRGRSDLIQSFDFINVLEETIFDEADRIKMIKSFIWDVLIKGANDDQIKEFLSKNGPPKPGSIRAHNEQVTWTAVAPDLKIQDSKTFFEFFKAYLATCQNRPDSWLGGGGKAYQNEADLMGEPTFKDLGVRQLFVKFGLEDVCRYVLDCAVLRGSLVERDGKRFEPNVNMPEMVQKNLKLIVDALFSLCQALVLATANRWVTRETAAKMFAAVAEKIGVDIDAADEIKKTVVRAVEDGVTEDYAAREAVVADLTARIEARMNANKAAKGETA